ncbi:MAG TPA: hypothetical protein VJV23_03490 [Candidatus Polarisedimenticolia bacterium]|nr:hypothetical protein [Candidatus Polarisedimenticolia bacterium]
MTPRGRDALFHGAAVFLLGAYPFAKFLRHNDYPLARPEVALLASALLLPAAAAAIFCRSRALLATLYALLLAAMLTATGHRLPARVLLWAAAAAAAAWILVYLGERLRKPIVALFTAGCLVSEAGLALAPGAARGAAAPGDDPSAAAPRGSGGAEPLSHVVHLIVDEHIGLDGLPASLPESAPLREALESFYLSRGFTLHPKAYSHYASSQDAIPGILNDRLVDQAGGFFQGAGRRDLAENLLFDRHLARGRAVRVYQSRYINYCAHPGVQGCYRYNDNTIHSLEGQPYSAAEKAWVVGSEYLATNALYHRWGKKLFGFDTLKVKVGPLGTIPGAFQRLAEDIAAARSSTLFFAHLHMPHSPYVYDRSCRPRPVAEWMLHRDDAETGGDAVRGERWRARHQAYAGQIECLNRMLGELFDGMERRGLYDGATILVHGDHGSRITLAPSIHAGAWEAMDGGDKLSLFSTLAAVKPPSSAGGRIDPAMRSVAAVVAEATGGASRPAVEPQDGIVFLREKPGRRGLKRLLLEPF